MQFAGVAHVVVAHGTETVTSTVATAMVRPLSVVIARRGVLWQPARMEPAYIRTGELREGRSVLLDEAVPLAAGRVRVTVQAIERARPLRAHAEVLTRIRPRQLACGHLPPTKEKVDRRIAEERASWD